MEGLGILGIALGFCVIVFFIIGIVAMKIEIFFNKKATRLYDEIFKNYGNKPEKYSGEDYFLFPNGWSVQCFVKTCWDKNYMEYIRITSPEGKKEYFSRRKYKLELRNAIKILRSVMEEDPAPVPDSSKKA